jgi:hypothetical protein
MAAAAVLASATAGAAPTRAAPVTRALGAAAASLGDVERTAIVCGRWRCWHMWAWDYGYRPWDFGYRPWGWGYGPRYYRGW